MRPSVAGLAFAAMAPSKASAEFSQQSTEQRVKPAFVRPPRQVSDK
jgi:hypothetical protein